MKKTKIILLFILALFILVDCKSVVYVTSKLINWQTLYKKDSSPDWKEGNYIELKEGEKFSFKITGAERNITYDLSNKDTGIIKNDEEFIAQKEGETFLRAYVNGKIIQEVRIKVSKIQLSAYPQSPLPTVIPSTTIIPSVIPTATTIPATITPIPTMIPTSTPTPCENIKMLIMPDNLFLYVNNSNEIRVIIRDASGKDIKRDITYMTNKDNIIRVIEKENNILEIVSKDIGIVDLTIIVGCTRKTAKIEIMPY